MKKTLFTILALLALVAMATTAVADDSAKIKRLEKRLQKLELKANKNKINWSGDLRVEAHSLTGETADYYDGMALQQVMVNSMFYHQFTGNLPMNQDGSFNYDGAGGVLETIGGNYVPYMQYLQGLDFNTTFPQYMNEMLFDMGQAMFFMQGGTQEQWDGMLQDEAAFAAFMGQVQDGAMGMMKMVDGLRESYKTDNDIMYTTRLRLNMHAQVAKNVTFDGRLSMYKPWGSSTQVGVFNGQANTMYMDANEPGVPGASTLHVDRAYFTWSKINDMPLYLSLGRRPSTDGPPLHYRHDEPRAGTPMGTIIDMQFDGATFGYNFSDKTTVRACYGLGYESQYGNGSLSARPQDRLKDASFFGFNIDAWNTPEMSVQTTIARAFNITDGFNGYVIMPNDPVTGQAMPGPIMTRFSPSANLGEFDLASIMVARTDGPVDWFVSGSWSKSRPEEGVTTPFGGFFADPFAAVEEQTGSMYYLGARYSLSNNKTKIGLEWNKGSQYWFNFAPAQDDLVAPKTSTRGSVIEGYITHRVNPKFVLKLGYKSYDYDYSGSGWHLGAPKELVEGADAPILGFPTYKKVGQLTLGFDARF
jgi:hypothetical protein